MIYWANDIYRIKIGSWAVFPFFPEGFYNFLGIPQRLAEGMAFHFFFMWLFFANGLLYVIYLIFSKEWKHIFPNRHSLREGWQQLLFDLHLSKKEPKAEKYNGAQRIAYSAVVVMGIVMILTGLAIYKPVQLDWLAACFGGYQGARLVHFVVTVLFVLFFVVHILQVVRAGWNNFRSMVAGFEIVKKEGTTETETPKDD